jgi:hypothetical protein
MFEVLNNISKVLTSIAPHNVLNALINGGGTSIYDQSSFMEQTGWHPNLTTNQMEKGVTFSDLKLPATYVGQMDQAYKAEFSIYNQTDHPKKLHIEFYQDLYEITGYHGRANTKMSSAHPQIAPPRVVLIAPGGAEKIEFWYNTPPSPRPVPEYGDILYITIVVQMIDEQGKIAILRKKSKAVIPPVP